MKSVSIYYPKVTADLAKIIADKNINGSLEVNVNISDASDIDPTETKYLPVYVEDYRGQFPKPLVGRAYVDFDDPTTITIEVFSPDFAKKLLESTIDHFSITTDDYVQ